MLSMCGKNIKYNCTLKKWCTKIAVTTELELTLEYIYSTLLVSYNSLREFNNANLYRAALCGLFHKASNSRSQLLSSEEQSGITLSSSIDCLPACLRLLLVAAVFYSALIFFGNISSTHCIPTIPQSRFPYPPYRLSLCHYASTPHFPLS